MASEQSTIVDIKSSKESGKVIQIVIGLFLFPSYPNIVLLTGEGHHTHQCGPNCTD
jgi:hypothetical protein